MIKVVAFSAMLIDHICQVYFPNMEKANVIGRLALPLFAYGISKGFKFTKNFKGYAFRLLILAIISQVPYFLLFKSDCFNVCFTLLAGLFVLKAYESKYNDFVKCGIIVSLFILVYTMNFEYGIYGISIIVIFYVFKNKYIIFLTLIFITILGIIAYDYFIVQIFAVFSFPLLLFLEKYDFEINRMLKYSFYPAHMLLIWIFTLIFPVN